MKEEKGAKISLCGRYRYNLWRKWEEGKRLLWVMYNPSTADGQDDDPTIRRCRRFAKDHGFGSMEIVNLFSWRSTSPTALPSAEVAVGPLNNEWIVAGALRADAIVAAWGSRAGGAYARARTSDVVNKVVKTRRLQTLGLTKAGHPRHPLYVPSKRFIRQWLQPEWMPPAKMKRVICHWTGGDYVPSSGERRHYHLLIDGQGGVTPGLHRIDANESIRAGTSTYAAHTRKCNTGSIGVACCAMLDATPRDFGEYPLKTSQWKAMAGVVAQLCKRYGIEVTPQTVSGTRGGGATSRR